MKSSHCCKTQGLFYTFKVGALLALRGNYFYMTLLGKGGNFVSKTRNSKRGRGPISALIKARIIPENTLVSRLKI